MEDLSRKLEIEPKILMKKDPIKPKKIFELMGAKQQPKKKVQTKTVKTKKKKGKKKSGY